MVLRNEPRRFAVVLLAVLAAAVSAQAPAEDSEGPSKLADVLSSRGGLEWSLRIPTDGAVLTVRGPSGRVERLEVPGGARPFFSVVDASGGARADGSYVWELRPVVRPRQMSAPGIDPSAETADGRSAARAAAGAAASAAANLAQTGSFAIRGGAIDAGGSSEAGDGGTNRAVAPGGALLRAEPGAEVFDQVTADDLIVQGSVCVGFDCVNNESFGFDTVRLKENNLRIKFEDTSVGTFPTTDWQLTANDSASGGQNKFSIEDITSSRVPFTVEGAAETNSLYVDSTGRVGLRTSTPVLDVHANTSNTPALRLEQNGSGGFTAQTWDVAGNEANFFIRDVTSGSRLPFRIRPGAPTSSIDINASGDVGIGTASPAEKLHVSESADVLTFAKVENTNTGPGTAASLMTRGDLAEARFGVHGSGRTIQRFGKTLGGWSEALAVFGNGFAVGTLGAAPLVLGTNATSRMEFSATTGAITTSTGASLSAGGVWTNASSRELKQDIRELSPVEAREALEAMTPVRYAYRADPEEQHVGFIAEDVPDLVATRDRKGLSPMDMVAVLARVVKEQQETIEQLSARLARLESGKE